MDNPKHRIRDRSIRLEAELHRKISMLEVPVSATLIGPPVDTRRIEKVNDLDHLIIVDSEMTPDIYERIRQIFEELRNDTSSGTDVLYAIADGPMKPASEKEYELFYHVILHTAETYRNSPMELGQNSWQYERQFLGRSAESFRMIGGVKKEMLLNGTMSLRHMTELVATDSSSYLGWEKVSEGGMQMNAFPLQFSDPGEKIEMYIYAILRGASNTLRYMTGNNMIGIDEGMCRMFAETMQHIPLRHLPHEAYKDKRILRNRNLSLPHSFVSTYQDKTIAFLTSLYNDIQSIK